MAMLDYSDIKDSVHKGSYSDPTPLPSSLSPPRLMIASSPFSPCRALFLGCCSIRLPRDRAASAPYWYHLLPVPPVYVPIYSSHVGFRFAPANEICCYARLYLMKSDKPRRPSSGFGKLVLVKKAWSPFNLALGGEGTVRDSCYLFDSSDMRVMLRISDSLRFRHHHPPSPTRRRGGSTVFHSRHQRFHERPDDWHAGRQDCVIKSGKIMF
ncbi:hypothetical protein C4D60_Mb07t18360 [Musa balbisiana]|uniref:Uncharacterized protein n=1 Tax=Musa balbisiana TaxID=52838 RepID=A0A4S8JGG4_MUSBA|nr:hypothetical protein C4D60_Mb07t18360 [Musa balbisiana]